MRHTVPVRVEWELGGISLEAAGVTAVVEIPMTHYLRGDNDVSEYLSDTYGWLVLSWCDDDKKTKKNTSKEGDDADK